MSRPERIIPGVVLLGAMVLLLLGAAMTGAGVDKVRAEAFMESWAQKEGEPPVQAWEAARHAAAGAVVRYPVANGEYEDRLGRVYLWQHYRQPFGVEEARDSREQARQAFQRSLAARPIAPATHARLAHAYLYLRQLDKPLFFHIGIARRQGPWQPDVNRELAEVGLVAWPSLAKAQREQAMDAFCATLLVPAPSQDPLLDLAQRAQQSPAACRKGRYVRQG